MDERLNAERSKKAYEDAAYGTAKLDVGPLQSAGVGRGYGGEAGATMAQTTAGPSAPDAQWFLANRRNQLLREAEGIQQLIDALPSKLPYGAAEALRALVLK